jgi:hypothetical protein
LETEDYERPGTQTIVNTAERELFNSPTIPIHDDGGKSKQRRPSWSSPLDVETGKLFGIYQRQA